MKKICLILATVLIISSNGVYAQSTDSLNKELQSNMKEQENINEKIISLNNKINSTDKEIQDSNTKLENINIEIEKVNEEIYELEKKEEENKELLEKRLRASNKNLSLGYIQILFRSESITDFLGNLHTIKEIVSYDKTILDELAKNSETLETKNKDLNLKQDELKILSNTLNSKKIGLEEDKKELEELKSKLEKEEDDIESKISELTNINQYTGEDPSGNYVVSNNGWPVQGYTRVSSPYGMRMHPVLKVRKMHTGIDIPAPTGTNVLSVDDGKVIFSGVQSGYGNTVMILHDDGKVSLYAHNSRNTVSNGQRVSKGQVIAKIGSTGRSTGPHLHFEIRINGNHVNPINYLR